MIFHLNLRKVPIYIVGGKDALAAFRESDEKGYLEVDTKGLKQLTPMGSLVLCCGDGASWNSTNMYIHQCTASRAVSSFWQQLLSIAKFECFHLDTTRMFVIGVGERIPEVSKLKTVAI